jgi:hypothetical protein
VTDLERDSRSGDQWTMSVLGYLRWRAGEDWRKVHLAKERWNDTRWYYLHAFRLMSELRFASAPPCQCPRYCVALPPKKTVRAVRLPEMERTA